MERATRSFYFSYVLYPQENKTHERLFKYIVSHFSYAYIEHPHIYDDDPKTHTHIVFKLSTRSTINGVNKFFQTDYVKIVESIQGAMLYLVHDTMSCIDEFENGNLEKRPYSIENIVTNSQKWLSLIKVSDTFNLCSEILDSVSRGNSIWEAIKNMPESEKNSALEFVLNHSSFVHLANQHISKLRYERDMRIVSGYTVIDNNSGEAITNKNYYSL